jgi:hypothetical protein
MEGGLGGRLRLGDRRENKLRDGLEGRLGGRLGDELRGRQGDGLGRLPGGAAALSRWSLYLG